MKHAAKLIPYIILVFVPIVYTLAFALMRETAVMPNFFEARRLTLIKNTFLFSFATAAIDVVIGTLCALALYMMKKRWRNLFVTILAAALAFPPYIYALAWIRSARVMSGVLPFRLSISGWGVALFIQSIALLPFAILVIYCGLYVLDKSYVESSLALGSSKRSLVRVMLPMIKNYIVAAFCILYLLTLGDYAIPSIFSVIPYSIEVFVEYSTSFSLLAALLMAIPLLVLSLPAAFVLAIRMKHISVRLSYKQKDLPRLAHRREPMIPFFLLFAIHWALLLFAFVMIFGDPRIYGVIGGTLRRFSESLSGSFLISSLSGLFALPVIYLATDFLEKKNTVLAWFLLLLPLSIPAPAIGTFIIGLWNNDILGVLYGTILMPVLGVMIRFMPVGILLLAAAKKGLHKRYMENAQVLEGSRFRNVLRVEAGLILPALYACFAIVFVLGLSELGATIMTLPPGTSTLTTRIYDYLHYGASEQVAILCMLQIITVSLLMVPTFYIRRKKDG